MSKSMMPSMASGPREINGIPLYTKSGKVRERFSEKARLTMLGGLDKELNAFMRLFTPRLYPYIFRRQGEGWVTRHHALSRDEVVKHLLADRIPGVDPIWTGTRGWGRTMHAAIDVDFRRDRDDFEYRCKTVEKVLLRLGISRKRMLVCPSPSGGRHYRIFFSKPVFTYQLPILFQMAGLPLKSGKFEVYPSETQGFRLPFGYIPGQQHDPRAWVKFIRAYKRKDFPRINWDQMVKRALSIQQRASSRPSMPSSQVIPAIQPPTKKLGIPKRLQNRASLQGMVKNAALGGNNPHPTVGKRIWREKIQEIWDQGITEPGTRLSLTKALAWHMMFIERLPAAEVSTKLVEWVYRTGKTTSKDVQNDLVLGSRKVEQKTRKYVSWFESRRQKNSFQPRKLFAKQELDHLLQLVKTLPSDLQSIRARFLLDFLNFAKKYGRKSEKGYECNPSVDGVIKKWENCRNAANYKDHLDWAVEVGLLVLVKEKSQRAHRARTYAVVVPFAAYEEWSLGFQNALDYLQEALSRGEDSSIEMRRRASSDGYRRIVSLESSEDHNLPRVRCGERVAATSNSLILEDGTLSYVLDVDADEQPVPRYKISIVVANKIHAATMKMRNLDEFLGLNKVGLNRSEFLLSNHFVSLRQSNLLISIILCHETPTKALEKSSPR